MTVIPKNAGKEVPVIEDGMYDLYCHGAKVEENRDEHDEPRPDDYGRWQYVRFNFEVVGVQQSDGTPTFLDPRTSMSLYDGSGRAPTPSALYTITKALGIDTSEGFDTDLAAGKKCRGVVSTKAEGEWPRIVQWLPPAKAAQKAPTRPVQGRQPSQNPAVVEDSVAESIALLKSLKEEMDEADFTLLRGEIMARFPETDGGSRGFFPQKIDRENNAAAMLAFIKEHVGEAVPFA